LGLIGENTWETGKMKKDKGKERWDIMIDFEPIRLLCG
jgi:hypothetical protein